MNAATARSVHVVLPGDVDDLTVPSGGNVYDRRVCRGLAASGWQVHEIPVPGSWPRPDETTRAELVRALTALPDGTVVLLDGLVACGVPEVVVPQARRLRLAVLVHLPLADETGTAPQVVEELDSRERVTLRAATVVLATSPWAGRRLVDRHGLDPGRVHVVPPGVDPAPLAPGTDGASRLLCVASVTPRKGQDLLVRALGSVGDLPWSCVCAGPLRRDPGYVGRLRALIGTLGLGDRVRLAGPYTGGRLAALYAAADLLVLPSRAETYGMVVTEALARGIPVLATAVDAVPQTLGRAPDGGVPGLLTPPEDPRALADALRRWLGEPALRRRIKTAARARRDTLDGWETTVHRLGNVLDELLRRPLKAA
ncbi:Glycosyl transferases group 1 [Thermomonospora echinospora]|uniref:Glycosyl transferases group 1 n=1 Tax=Thermomonospora echinospora TaxID=1992 RepID=A0A1H6C330_9ACTN|nr:glycosyltransferase family 4 protein [Thermomonospora echinospora]SEG67107.1 Glycosyl transferases group 1 [Thermomonospora echinospora]